MNSHRFISPFYLLLPALLVLLPACKKNWFTRTTEVKVWVVEKGTKIPVEGAEVVLLEGSPGGFLGMPAWSIRERCTTNVLGYCYFKFEPNDDDGYVAYEVKAEHPNYYGPALSDIEVGQRNKKKLVLQPEAWLKVYVKNVNKEYNRFFLDDYGTPSGGGYILRFRCGYFHRSQVGWKSYKKINVCLLQFWRIL